MEITCPGGFEQKCLGRLLPLFIRHRAIAGAVAARPVRPLPLPRVDKEAQKLLSMRPRFSLSLASSLLRENTAMPKP